MPGNAGENEETGNPDTPRKSISPQVPLLRGNAGVLPEAVPPRRVFGNGDPCLPHQFLRSRRRLRPNRPPAATSSPASYGAPMPRGRLADADAQALSEAIEDRRAALAGKAAGKPRPEPKAASGPPRAARRREKMFGVGRPRALDRNAKVEDHALGALPQPQDGEGQGVRRRHGEGAGRARGAAMGLPQRQERALLPVAMRRSPRPPVAPARPSPRRSRRLRTPGS